MSLVTSVEERAQRLRNLLIEFQFCFKQVCGQRIFGPPRNYNGVRPVKGCEVFVTNIPRDVYEDEIIRLFAEAGALYQVKFMMEFSGMNRGFAYFSYVDRRSAARAINMFHGYVITPGAKRLACYISLDNSKLYFEGMPTNLSVEEAEAIMKDLFDDCENVTVFRDCNSYGRNLGIGFVEFATHRRAAEIRKMIWPSRIAIMNSRLFFEWAVPLPDFREHHVIIITNISRKIDNKTLTGFVVKQTEGCGCIRNITKRGSFATVQCPSESEAINCADKLSGKRLLGHPLTVFVVDTRDERIHDLLILFLQWAVYEPRSVVVTALHEFLVNPHESIANLAPYMRYYLRDTNAVIMNTNRKFTMNENRVETSEGIAFLAYSF